MNRRYNQFRLGLENKMIDLYVRASIGASGAATISAAKSKGVASIVRGGTAGLYTVTLQDRYVDLFAVIPTITLAAGSPVAPIMVVRAQDVDGAKTIELQFLDETLAAADLPSGAVLGLKFELKGSST